MSEIARGLAPLKNNKVRVKPEHGVDPDAYAVELVGNCLEPEFFSGDMAICSPAAPIEAGRFVALWFVKEGPPLLKRLLHPPFRPVGSVGHPDDEVMPAVIVEMLNPYRTFAIPIDKLKAMHRVVGRYREEEVAAMREPVPQPAKQRRKGKAR